MNIFFFEHYFSSFKQISKLILRKKKTIKKCQYMESLINKFSETTLFFPLSRIVLDYTELFYYYLFSYLLK